MKKLFLFVALCATITLSAGNLPFKLGGYQATTENVETLVDSLKYSTSAWTVSGKLSYDEAADILIMDTLQIDGTFLDNLVGFEFEASKTIRILLNGKNSIACFAPFQLNDAAKIRIFGAGSLTVKTDEEGAAPFMLGDESKLEFMYTTLDASAAAASAFVAKKGDAAKDISITFNNTKVDIKYGHKTGEKGYAFENVNTVNLEACPANIEPVKEDDEDCIAMRVSAFNTLMEKLWVSNADQYEFSPADKNFKYGANPVRRLEWILDSDATKNRVSIGGVMNESAEYTWKDLVRGKAQLKNDTLFLEDVLLSPLAGNTGITFYANNPIIHLSGENEISAHTTAGLFAYSSISFVGEGSLRVVGLNAGIMTDGGVWVKGQPQNAVEIYAGAKGYGFWNMTETDAGWTLMVDDGSDFRASGGNKALFLNNTNEETKGLSLRYGTVIAEPYDIETVFDAQYVRFASPKWIEMIEIEGHRIHEFNCAHLHELIHSKQLDKGGDKSEITYDEENKTLHFVNSYTTWKEANKTVPFLKTDQALTIDAKGENQIIMKDSKAFIETTANVTIQGSDVSKDKLFAYGQSTKGHCGIFANMDKDVELTFSNLTVGAHQCINALYGSSSDNKHKVHFNHASVYMDAEKEATKYISEMTFDKAKITKPEGAEFSAALQGIALDGFLVSEQVVLVRAIDEEEKGIEQIGTSSATRKAIIDGNLYILLEDGTKYDATGRKQ